MPSLWNDNPETKQRIYLPEMWAKNAMTTNPDIKLKAALESYFKVHGNFKLKLPSAKRLLDHLEENQIYTDLNTWDTTTALAMLPQFAKRNTRGWCVWYPQEAKVIKLKNAERPQIGLAMARAALKREKDRNRNLEQRVVTLEKNVRWVITKLSAQLGEYKEV